MPTDERRTTLPYIPKRKIRYGYVNIGKRKDLLNISTAQTKGLNWNCLPATPGSPCGPAGPEIGETDE